MKFRSTNPQTGEQKVHDLDNPDKEMLVQLCDVALNRVKTSHQVIKMLYLDNDYMPKEAQAIKEVFADLVEGKIDSEEAYKIITEFKLFILLGD